MSRHPQKPGFAGDAGPENFGAVIMLLQLASATGPAWAYVAVASENTSKLLSLAGKAVAPDEYGKVLLKGEGETPPAEAREYIYDMYGFDS